MTKKINDASLDVRSLELNISRGNLVRKDYEGYIKALPDLTGIADIIPAYEEPQEDAGEDLTFSVV